MPLSLLQIVLLAIILFTLTRVILRMKEGRLEVGSFIFWVLIWITAIAAVLFPDVTTNIANQIGVGRGADAIIYISLIVLFYLIFRTNVAMENIQQNLTQLVRELSLEKTKKRDKKAKQPAKKSS